MPLFLSIVVADTHTPGARPLDLSADLEDVLAPLLKALEARTSMRLALHLSQTMLDHLASDRPDLVPRLQSLAKKKRVQLLCSTARGSVPWLGMERDAVGQIRQHRTYIEREFSGPVRGAWPTGFAWDPSWPRFLGRIGLRYTLCSMRALAAGGAGSPVRSWVKVRAEGHRASLIPFDSDLMHRIPYATPTAVIETLRTHAERGVRAQALVLPMARLSRWGADTTGQYLTELLDGLAKQGGWLRLVPPELLLERTSSAGQAHPPASTPLHVGVGALGEDTGSRLLDTADAAVLRHDLFLRTLAPGLTGPPLDAFVNAWPAAGSLLDRATRVSSAVGVLRRRAAREKRLQGSVVAASKALWTGSSSGVLWDGDGGSVGEPGARWQAWTALMEAEDILWSSQGAKAAPEVDAPEDGGPVHLRTARMVAAVDPVGGAVSELSVRGLGNIVNILTPRPRPWTDRLGDLSLPCLVSDSDLEADEDAALGEGPGADPAEEGDAGRAEDEGEVLGEDGGSERANDGERVDGEGRGYLEDEAPGPAENEDADHTVDGAVDQGSDRQSDLEDDGDAIATDPDVATDAPSDSGGLFGAREVRGEAPIDDSARGLAEFDHPLALFQDFLLPEGTTTEALALGMAAEQGDFASGDWRVERAETNGTDVELLLVREGTVGRPPARQGMLQVSKRMQFGGKQASVSVRWTVVNRSRETLRTRLGVVLPLNLDGTLAADRTLHVPDAAPFPHDAQGLVEDVADFALRYGKLGALVRARPDDPVRVQYFPLVAPVRRREGHVGVFQGTVAILSWPLELWGNETREYGLTLEIHQR